MMTEYSYEALLNAIPMPVFIVDDDLVVSHVNHAAIDIFNLNRGSVLFERWGSALQCVNCSDSPSGCGYGEDCKSCVIRNSVTDCFKGPPIIQRKTTIALKAGGTAFGCELLITVNQIMNDNRIYALFMIEDMTKLSMAHSNIPVCMHCKKLREDDNHWSNLEDFLDHNLHVKFSQCICELCLEKYYPDVAAGKLTCH